MKHSTLKNTTLTLRPSCSPRAATDHLLSPDAVLEIEDFCAQWRQPAVRFALRSGLSYADAEDAVQNGLCKACRHFDPSKGRFAARFWFLLPLNIGLTKWQNYWLVPTAPEDFEHLPAEGTSSPEVSQHWLQQVICNLPPELVRLLEAPEESLREAAAAFGLSYTAFTSRRCRARAALRELLRRAGCESVDDVAELGARLLAIPAVIPSVKPACAQPRPSCKKFVK
jgi:DNA-directed RNA polymerase specialized sigma24 family protein